MIYYNRERTRTNLAMGKEDAMAQKRSKVSQILVEGLRDLIAELQEISRAQKDPSHPLWDDGEVLSGLVRDLLDAIERFREEKKNKDE
ncbi:hypothetical protein DRH29_02820 [candidate division Kazan bacterium]|uniref:Uncharacterized protein n=1 Tax=candidate division Kazan bacterium TaxID=2202143 RepID=A0A420ZCM7_UNCK3|nr:MAG: hypothetical protein DRH29_02820 [candidate division Kazan bacterium]